MKDMPTVRRNERIRSVSRSLLQLGTALLAAAAVKAYHDRAFSVDALVWLVGSTPLIWVRLSALDLLESEDE